MSYQNLSLDAFNQQLLDFLQHSPTPFHAVQNLSRLLLEAGFEQLKEEQSWPLQAQGRYFVVRNGSSLVAWIDGQETPLETGLRMVGAHTDSPCLKVKPNAEVVKHGYAQLGVEVYGGALLNPWFDRDLSLAGRVTFVDQRGQMRSRLVNFEQPLAVIPSLAIHLDREANKNRSINPQKDLPPILLQLQEGESWSLKELLNEQLIVQYGDLSIAQILDWELFFYDCQAPSLVGLKDQFIASARLDNLLSCYIGLQSLLNADGRHSCVLVCNDHEEVGSASACGAQGPMLEQALKRWLGDDYDRTIAQSLMISADNAHGIHPNHADRHDANHGPLLNQGPVIKINANQRYATNSETSAVFRHLASRAGVPVQAFVVRTDMACGSTIGPITASGLGVATLDIGVPTFAMHSIRELAGNSDAYGLFQILALFNNSDDILPVT